jgi:hypothetical protein
MTASSNAYEKCTEVSERVAWKISDVLGEGKFDYTRRFLPEKLAQVSGIPGLSDAEKLRLNQIRGLTYAHLFGFVEEYIVQQSMKLAAAYPADRPIERRALLRFAEEETKHQLLFEKTKAALREGLGDCGLLPGAADVAGVILSKSELCVLLLTTMLELITRDHYTDMFRSTEERELLDPTFMEIFKSHWLEESQHAKLDQLEVERVSKSVSAAARETAIDELLEIGGAFDGILKAQADLDLVSLERLAGRTLPDDLKRVIHTAQHKAYRYTFLVTGLSNPAFRDIVGSITTGGVAKISAAATALSA